MKFILILFLTLFLLIGGASADILVYSYSGGSESSCSFDRGFPTECHVFHIVDLDNLEAGETFRWHMPFTTWDNLPIVATAGPDDMIYARSRRGDPENLYRFSISADPPNSPTLPDRLTYGTSAELATSAHIPDCDDYSVLWQPFGCVPNDWAVRKDAGIERYYYSMATGGTTEDAEPVIYYLDEDGTHHLYYTVDLNELPHRFWDGKFTFDDINDVLYLSNGIYQRPASIFKITGAYPDRVQGDVEEIFDIDDHIVGIQFVGPNYIYFSTGSDVYRINVNAEDISGSLKLVYSSPGSMDDLAVIGTGELHIPEFIQEREGILKPDKSIDKKDKKVDIKLVGSKLVLIRPTSTGSKYMETQADNEQSSKQMSIAANLGSLN